MIFIMLLAYIIFEQWKIINASKKVREELDIKLDQLNRTIQILSTRLGARNEELFVDQLDGKEDESLNLLYHMAVKIVQQEGKVSVTLLSRRLEIGYARAARIIDQLEAQGVVGPQKGVGPRKLLM
ncbi:hypothetical protein A2957_02005 [Candidatus Roizmanbacteria bacterium RIFCSPLOWO2_01_FULL_38_11]|uniref:FtsK gamma domain-containing protein n=1 Tax=Candidatus Roizmanbacteria bacterium RIFCSPLOWO2_01_FULL_38_11 TaxID=1802060 RepID=A0A1F7IM40_9BACT|nr:MAG: hypothetical protein A2957_02005 [Candidatus Roizmanbacteria bacterium RIFCSPLOWO2_01_FULL_38_11]